jgi:SNF2 family DNA or RNA helicase
MVAESTSICTRTGKWLSLADDMGLGKTLQLLCFIGEYRKCKDKKPVLVVAQFHC